MLLLDNFTHADLHPGNIMIKFYKPSTTFVLKNMLSSIFGTPTPDDPLQGSQAASDISDDIVERLRPLRHSPDQWLKEMDRLSEEGFQPELVLLDAGLVTVLHDDDRRNFLDLFRAIAEFDVSTDTVITRYLIHGLTPYLGLSCGSPHGRPMSKPRTRHRQGDLCIEDTAPSTQRQVEDLLSRPDSYLRRPD